MSTDLELLERYVQRQDREALGALYERHWSALVRVTHALVSQDSDPRDTVQAAFLKAMGACDRFRGEGSVRTWLLRIAVNEARDAHRRTRFPVPADLEACADGMPPPETLVEKTEFERGLTAALADLPSAQAEPLVLHYWEHLSLQEIAELLETPKSTIHSRCQKGLARLRRTLDRRKDPARASLSQAFGGLIAMEGVGRGSGVPR